MKNPFILRILRWLTLLFIIIVVGIGGYLLGSEKINANQVITFISSKQLVEISYDGGWPADPAESVRSYGFYDNGDVYKTTGDGRIVLYTTLLEIQLETIRDLINDPATLDSFVKKDRTFCVSAVDGIDSQITFITGTGGTASFSDCDYDFGEDNQLFNILNSIIRANR